jgi:hypothetical protein
MSFHQTLCQKPTKNMEKTVNTTTIPSGMRQRPQEIIDIHNILMGICYNSKAFLVVLTILIQYI